MRNREIEAKRKEMIFDAAVHCFNEKGYDAATIDTIAARANVSKGCLYHYFSSKRELFLELFGYRVNKYLHEMTSSIKEEDTPENRLRTVLKKAGQLLRKHNDFYKFSLQFLSMGVRDREIRKVMTEFYKDSIEILRQIVEEGIETGEFRDVESGKVARMVYFLVMGVFLTDVSVDIDFDVTDQVSFHINSLFTSVRNTDKGPPQGD